MLGGGGLIKTGLSLFIIEVPVQTFDGKTTAPLAAASDETLQYNILI